MLPNKLGAMMIIFLTASPIRSLLRMLMLALEYFYRVETNEESNSFLVELFSPSNKKLLFPGGVGTGAGDYMNRNITVEDIIQTVLHQYAMPLNYPLKNPVLWSSNRLNQDLQIVLPWLCAFTTLIIFPLTMVVLNALWRRGEMETTYRNKRISIFQLCLKSFQKEIVTDDIISSEKRIDARREDGNNSSGKSDGIINDWDKNDLFITIPKPGVPYNPSLLTSKNQLRQVTGTCAICLSSYEKGEHIVWSSCGECIHAFHLGCIEEWIQKRYVSSCPCCRREFIDSEVYTKMKLKKKL